MAWTKPRTLTCACGKEFTTFGPRSVRCEACQHARNLEKRRAWDREHAEEKNKYAAERRAIKRLELRAGRPPRERKPREAKEVPCMGGCGTMVLTTNSNGRVMCPACRKESKRQSNARYKASDKGKAAQAAANMRASMDEERKQRNREADHRRYLENREERLAKATAARRARGIEPRPKRPPKVKPLEAKPRVVKAITLKAKAVVQEAPARRLPTEEEKLLMFRAAMKRYYGD